MIARFAEWQGRKHASVAADATYGNGECRLLVGHCNAIGYIYLYRRSIYLFDGVPHCHQIAAR
jgi:hypothetical protein